MEKICNNKNITAINRFPLETSLFLKEIFYILYVEVIK